MPQAVIPGISPGFPGLSQSQRQVAHVLLTRSPLEYPRKGLSARLACIKHAASVRPEPGSNSPTKTCEEKPRHQKCRKQHPKTRGTDRNQNNRHWHHKHPVEFSKNNPTRGNSPTLPGESYRVKLFCR